MSFTLWVTTNCNLNCKYCYEGEEKLNKSMNKEMIDRSIDFGIKHFMNDESESNFAIHGGEPFLEFDTVKYIVKEIKERYKNSNKKPKFLTTTNATILNDEMIEFIVNEMPDITVSIDGTKETHDKMRKFKGGKGSHDIVLENSLKLLHHLPNIRIRMTFDSDTVNNLFEDTKFLIEKGFKIIVPAPNLFDKRWNDKHVNILEQQMKYIKTYIQDREYIAVSIVDKNEYNIKGDCNGGKTSIHIYPDGTLYPCVLAGGNEEFCIGNIYEGIDVEKRDKLLNISKEINTQCEGCKIYKYCDGPRCKIINKIITRDYNQASPMRCAMENLSYRIN